MGDGTEQNPFTREDVLRLIKENGGTAEGLDLLGIILERAVFSRSPLFGHDNLPAELGNIEDLLSSMKDVHLEGVTLERANLKEANLCGAHLEGADLTEACLEGAILTGSHLDGADLIGANLEGADLECTNLEGANLYSANLDGAYLVLTQFSRDTNFASVRWGNYILACELVGEFEDATDTYRELKMWHTEHGMYDIAGRFFYREMEAKRKAQSWKEKPHLKLWNWVLRLLCGYGEKPYRVVVWGISVLFGSALLYFFLRGVAPHTLTIQAFSSSLYYSAVSFTALGYGPWFSASSVRSWAQGVGAAEAIIGVFTIALFLVTFVRKMTR